MASDFVCPKNAYCTDKTKTLVGANKTEIYHRTVTSLTGQGPAYTGSITETYYKEYGIFSTGDWILAARSTDGGKTQTFTSDAGADLRKSMSPGGDMYKNVQANVQTTLAKGGQSGTLDKISPEQQKKAGIIPQNAAAPADATQPAADAQKPTDADINTAKTDIVSTNPNTRDGPNTYGNLRYPLKLKDNQDYINIIMLKYVPKPIGQNTTAGTPSPRGNKDRLTLGSVTLPIPAGISDSNRVNWGDDSLQPLESALADIMTSGITGQNGGVGGATERALNTVAKNSTDAQKLFTSKFVQNTLGVNILKRNEGAIVNPNMELLFNSPSLRSFPFNFRLTPRSEDEAKMVRKIIRFFKQGMSVQRSKSELFLKAPNTFQITYCNGQSKDHPYLTKFKECALTDFTVNYTPDGSYMTYEGKEASMTAYEISMQFQELEPIFNDDYTKIDGNNDTYIGY
jgi:hypothetical protein